MCVRERESWRSESNDSKRKWRVTNERERDVGQRKETTSEI